MSGIVAQKDDGLGENTEGMCLPWCFCFLRAWFLAGAKMPDRNPPNTFEEGRRWIRA